MSESKHVQTELTNEEYQKFKTLAEERGLSLTAALHEAVEQWMENRHEVDPNDALFDVLSELDQEPAPGAPRTNATTEADLIEEWSRCWYPIPQISEQRGIAEQHSYCRSYSHECTVAFAGAWSNRLTELAIECATIHDRQYQARSVDSCSSSTALRVRSPSFTR